MKNPSIKTGVTVQAGSVVVLINVVVRMSLAGAVRSTPAQRHSPRQYITGGTGVSQVPRKALRGGI